MSIKEIIESRLPVLCGKSFWASGRITDLQWFQLGKRQQIITRKGTVKEVGEYALHVQCSWRIRGSQGIIVASQDRYYPKDGVDNIDEEFDWSVFGTTLCDVRIDAFVDEYCPLTIEALIADEAGGISIMLEQGFALELFPDSSLENEYWRIFRPGTENPHLVLEGNTLTEC